MKSDVHIKAQEAVRDYYQNKGFIAIIEYCVSGKKVDVLAQRIRSKYTIANEIQLTPEHTIENIELDFSIGCNEVVIISPDKTVLERIREKTSKRLSQYLIGKVRFQLIEDFIPHDANIKNNITK